MGQVGCSSQLFPLYGCLRRVRENVGEQESRKGVSGRSNARCMTNSVCSIADTCLAAFESKLRNDAFFFVLTTKAMLIISQLRVVDKSNRRRHSCCGKFGQMSELQARIRVSFWILDKAFGHLPVFSLPQLGIAVAVENL